MTIHKFPITSPFPDGFKLKNMFYAIAKKCNSVLKHLLPTLYSPVTLLKLASVHMATPNFNLPLLGQGLTLSLGQGLTFKDTL